jgi:hypothetical protein
MGWPAAARRVAAIARRADLGGAGRLAAVGTSRESPAARRGTTLATHRSMSIRAEAEPPVSAGTSTPQRRLAIVPDKSDPAKRERLIPMQGLRFVEAIRHVASGGLERSEHRQLAGDRGRPASARLPSWRI